MTSTIEIEKFEVDHTLCGKHQRGANAAGGAIGDMSDYLDYDDELAPTESDLSHVIKRADRNSKPIEVFTGQDPVFNVQNLCLRISMLERPQIIKMVLFVLLVLGCYIGVYL
eukprot:CAMPEP_0185599102 /NCGR_PEP_ID=MMETSP0434-20130131/82464_1 /TAXON_ID=626734 ORGANISM="Favella taraikaensis, Strain Fe Narragansett Bay" /NCGR_SAMPLE_ID=MMETSP0434 /ASSEMBLY_ACC=CAM_ASM_000379 /LENGTH=111 /DNA_ID=CAMNT_0028228359 /DNA_START=1811 /DNA_END=2143 /DNA_ORIENTATION=-